VLGTPVYTTFAGRMGGVDERLVAEGRLRPLTDADDLVVERKAGRAAAPLRRDPDQLLALALSGLIPL
jgi:predicted glycosyltransferase